MEIQNTKITRALLYKFALNINVLLHRLECHSYMNHLTRLYVYYYARYISIQPNISLEFKMFVFLYTNTEFCSIYKIVRDMHIRSRILDRKFILYINWCILKYMQYYNIIYIDRLTRLFSRYWISSESGAGSA